MSNIEINPDGLIELVRKSHTSFKVLMLLAKRMDRGFQVRCTQREMAAELSCSERTIGRSIKTLKEQHWVKVGKVDNKNTHFMNTDLISLPSSGIHYLYRFLDDEGVIIYVGETEKLENRVKTHLIHKNTGIPEEGINSIAAIDYCECESRDDAKIRERYMINTIGPKYNKALKNGSAFGFDLKSYTWKWISYRGVSTPPEGLARAEIVAV